MTRSTLHPFLHQWPESVTAIHGTAPLARRQLSSSRDDQTCLAELIHIARQRSDHIQGEMMQLPRARYHRGEHLSETETTRVDGQAS